MYSQGGLTLGAAQPTNAAFQRRDGRAFHPVKSDSASQSNLRAPQSNLRAPQSNLSQISMGRPRSVSMPELGEAVCPVLCNESNTLYEEEDGDGEEAGTEDDDGKYEEDDGRGVNVEADEVDTSIAVPVPASVLAPTAVLPQSSSMSSSSLLPQQHQSFVSPPPRDTRPSHHHSLFSNGAPPTKTPAKNRNTPSFAASTTASVTATTTTALVASPAALAAISAAEHVSGLNLGALRERMTGGRPVWDRAWDDDGESTQQDTSTPTTTPSITTTNIDNINTPSTTTTSASSAHYSAPPTRLSASLSTPSADADADPTLAQYPTPSWVDIPIAPPVKSTSQISAALPVKRPRQTSTAALVAANIAAVELAQGLVHACQRERAQSNSPPQSNLPVNSPSQTTSARSPTPVKSLSPSQFDLEDIFDTTSVVTTSAAAATLPKRTRLGLVKPPSSSSSSLLLSPKGPLTVTFATGTATPTPATIHSPFSATTENHNLNHGQSPLLLMGQMFGGETHPSTNTSTNTGTPTSTTPTHNAADSSSTTTTGGTTVTPHTKNVLHSQELLDQVRYISRHRANANANATSAVIAPNSDSNGTTVNVIGDEQAPAPAPALASHPQQLLLHRGAQVPLAPVSVTTVGAGMRIMRRHSIAGTASAGVDGTVGLSSEEGVSESMRRAMAFSSNTLKLRLASGQGLGQDSKARARATSPLLPLPGTREACQSMLRAMASHHTNTNKLPMAAVAGNRQRMRSNSVAVPYFPVSTTVDIAATSAVTVDDGPVLATESDDIGASNNNDVAMPARVTVSDGLLASPPPSSVSLHQPSPSPQSSCSVSTSGRSSGSGTGSVSEGSLGTAFRSYLSHSPIPTTTTTTMTQQPLTQVAPSQLLQPQSQAVRAHGSSGSGSGGSVVSTHSHVSRHSASTSSNHSTSNNSISNGTVKTSSTGRFSQGGLSQGGQSRVTTFVTHLGVNHDCPKCDKVIFKPEEVVAAGAAWHKSCFTCGDGGQVYGCRRGLTLDSYMSYGGWPFCKACYGKQFLQGGMVMQPVTAGGLAVALRVRPSQAAKSTTPLPLSSLPQTSLRPTTSPHPASSSSSSAVASVSSSRKEGQATTATATTTVSATAANAGAKASAPPAIAQPLSSSHHDNEDNDDDEEDDEEEEEVDVIPSPIQDHYHSINNVDHDDHDDEDKEDNHHSFQPFRRLTSLDFAGAMQVHQVDPTPTNPPTTGLALASLSQRVRGLGFGASLSSLGSLARGMLLASPITPATDPRNNTHNDMSGGSEGEKMGGYTSPMTEGKGQGQGQVTLCLEGEGEGVDRANDQHTPVAAALSSSAVVASSSLSENVDNVHVTTANSSASSNHSQRSLGNQSIRSLGHHSVQSLGNHSVRSLGNNSTRSRDSVTIGNVTWPPVKSTAAGSMSGGGMDRVVGSPEENSASSPLYEGE